MAFAAVHLALSGWLCGYVATAAVAQSLGGGPSSVVERVGAATLVAMHPAAFAVLGGGPIDLGDPAVVACVVADSLLWGFAAAWTVRRLRRTLSAHRGRGLGDDDPPRPPHP